MVNVQRCRDYVEMSRRAAECVLATVTAKDDPLLCLPTGHSPAGLYEELIREAGGKPDLFRSLRVIKLDEWLGVPASDEASCEHFLQSRVLRPLAIESGRYIAFDSATADPPGECVRISDELARRGPIDLCILGLGKNGHLGLNEPAANLQPRCHVAQLTEQTRQHPMFDHSTSRPVQGLTIGIGDILQARKILLLITGKGKAEATARFLEGAVTTEVPATFLWLHHDVDVLLDESGR